MRSACLALLLAACKSASPAPDAGPKTAVRPVLSEAPFAKLAPLHHALPAPKPGDWLAEHPEPGQDFWSYVKSQPLRPSATRTTLYVLPLGDFTPAQRRGLEATERFLGAFFMLPVKVLPAVAAADVPAAARRKNPYTGASQLHTRWVLDELLPPKRPADALLLLAFTAEDLYPEESWNFVFGQASPEDSVGVWSMNRLGDAEREWPRFLLRMVKIASHEAGHLLGVGHCTANACVMNGSNNLEEADGQPLEPCPVCLRKLQWNVGFGLRERFAALAALEDELGLADEARFAKASLAALGPQ